MLESCESFVVINIYSDTIMDKYSYVKNLKYHKSVYQLIIDNIYYLITYYFNYIKLYCYTTYKYSNLQINTREYTHKFTNSYNNLIITDSNIIIYIDSTKLCIPYENIAQFAVDSGTLVLLIVGTIKNTEKNMYQLDTVCNYSIVRLNIQNNLFSWLYSTSMDCFNKIKNNLYYHLKYNNFNIEIIDIYNNLHNKNKTQ